MTSVSDIMAYAWDKDAVNLKAAVDTVMTDRIADQIEAMKQNIASTMFNTQNEVVEDDSFEEQETEELESDEGTQDENI
jgi:hypothetical protein